MTINNTNTIKTFNWVLNNPPRSKRAMYRRNFAIVATIFEDYCCRIEKFHLDPLELEAIVDDYLPKQWEHALAVCCSTGLRRAVSVRKVRANLTAMLLLLDLAYAMVPEADPMTVEMECFQAYKTDLKALCTLVMEHADARAKNAFLLLSEEQSVDEFIGTVFQHFVELDLFENENAFRRYLEHNDAPLVTVDCFAHLIAYAWVYILILEGKLPYIVR